MGLLTTGGAPMRWGTQENDRAKDYVITHGIEQFLFLYEKFRNDDNRPFLWGEEMEHNLVRLTDGGVLLSLNAADVLDALVKSTQDDIVDWRPEYGSFMVESVPRDPYTNSLASLKSVETNMRRRYELLDQYGGEGIVSTTLVTFPLMGVGAFTSPEASGSPHSLSLFVPDACINATHPRFANLTANIRLRRGRKVCIQVPLFIDKFTLERTVDKKLNIDANPMNEAIDCNAADSSSKKLMKGFGEADDEDEEASSAAATAPASMEEFMTHLYTPATDYYYAQYTPESQRGQRVQERYAACPCPVPSVTHPCIYMDCMAFGMGMHCLQVTMQLRNEREARHMYDQLAVICPPFLAITSATPFQKGLLADTDVRWLTIAASVDDRKREEVPRILKSRYDSVSLFLSSSEAKLDQFNDQHVEVNQACYDHLLEKGVDAALSRHISHLFIRDPLVIYDQMIEIDDQVHNEHFENVQSTNWQTVRFKIPPPNQDAIGWRVEFRVMDIMPTPFENAAFSVFVAMLAQATLKYNARFYTKMSAVDENMGKAHHRNPCREKYHWRKNVFAESIGIQEEEFEDLCVDEIFNGKEGSFVGFVPLVRRYMQDMNLADPQLEAYCKFISMRAAGKIPTAAQYLRNFVVTHADYKQDSRLTPLIARDLVLRAHGLASGTVKDESYLPMDSFFGSTPATSEDIVGNKRPRE